MNRTKAFMYNSAASMIMQAVVMISGFIVPRVILTHYGSDINGLTSSITQFISYFTLVEAGIGAAAVYSLYKPLAETDHKAISSIVVAAKRFYIFSGCMFAALTVVLALLFPFIRSMPELASSEISLLVLILGVSGALDFFTLSKYSVILTADQKTYVTALASSAATIINMVIIVVLADLNINIVAVRFIALSSIFLRSLILIVYSKKKYSFLDFRAKPDNNALSKRWDALYLQILSVVQIGAPVILTMIFVSYKGVSIYSIYNMVIAGINGVLGIFMSGLSASFGDIIARNQKGTLQTAYKQFEYTYYALLTVVYSCTMVLILPFVKIYTSGITDADYNAPVIAFLIVLNGFLFNLKTPQGMLVISAGMYKETKWQTTCQGIIAVAAGAALAPFWGIAGILAGSVLSNAYRCIDLLFFTPKHITKLSPRITFGRWKISAAEFAIICLPFYLFKIKAETVTEWVLLALTVFVYAVLVILLFSFLFDKAEMKRSMNRIISMVVRK